MAARGDLNFNHRTQVTPYLWLLDGRVEVLLDESGTTTGVRITNARVFALPSRKDKDGRRELVHVRRAVIKRTLPKAGNGKMGPGVELIRPPVLP